MTAAPSRPGVVASYDDAVGLGWVEESATGISFRFHCTQIADGSRHVDPGDPVTFDLIPARGGQWEAAAISRSSP